MANSWDRGYNESVLDWQRRIISMVAAYEAAIRRHRDQRGDDRCFLDDIELYGILPEGYEVGPQLDEPDVMLENCKRFIASRHNPECTYLSPQREIDRLEARVKELEERLKTLAVR